ncbi:hypothetical protein KSS87_000703 [Heliosperma pusillum]|nr:hypothetical protein KSS87_000703 [Heliosperma pusillum]
MEAHKSVPETKQSTPARSSCRKKKNEEAAFLEDVKDHIDEFIHASMDEHKECFKNTMHKMFEMTKKVAGKSSKEAEVESVLPLQTTLSK